MTEVIGYKWTCNKCGDVVRTARKGGKQDDPAPLPEGWTQRVQFVYYETLCAKCAQAEVGA